MRDRRLLGLLITGGVMLLFMWAVVEFSGAYFTSTSRSPGNQFGAATMGLELATAGPIVDGSGLAPGTTRSGTQTVTNTGPREAGLTLAAANLDRRSPLAGVLRVTVQQTQPASGSPAYDGPLLDLGRLDLGDVPTGQSRTFKVTVSWPANETSSSLEGTTTSLDFRWTLESAS